MSRVKPELSRRERQIMDILYRSGAATASEVLARLPDPPSNSAVRTLLRILEEKGHLRHEQDGPRYVFHPIVPREAARRNAMRHLLTTFFDSSNEQAFAAMLDLGKEPLAEEELTRLQEMIDRARAEGR